jgi:hypothetical protein
MEPSGRAATFQESSSPFSSYGSSWALRRNDNIEVMPIIDANQGIAQLADGHRIRFLNINARLADARGVLLPGMTNDGLHLTVQAYQLCADSLKPLVERLGPKAPDDEAPPPTGDPSAEN